MEKKDLIDHSPVRYFDVTNAGLKNGELGLITAKKGLGKTSVLVQFGIDSLLNDKSLVHVSFDQKSSNVIAWYSSVMAEIAKKKNFNITDLEEEIVRNRTILNFNQETFTLPKVVNTLKALKDGGIKIELSDPKETPYLTMTQVWLKKVGANVEISEDFKSIFVGGKTKISSFDETIPGDWEAVAFPLVAALIAPKSKITIEHIDSSGTQGDEAIFDILRSVVAKIEWDKENERITAQSSRLSAENLPNGELRVALSPFPDAICALAVAALFIEGTTVLFDAAGCRKKETDRLRVMTEELTNLGAEIEEGEDFLKIRGHSPVLSDGSPNPAFKIHGGIVESHFDHRIAMSLACLGLGLGANEKIVVRNAECCSVSFPHFFDAMNELGADFFETE